MKAKFSNDRFGLNRAESLKKGGQKSLPNNFYNLQVPYLMVAEFQGSFSSSCSKLICKYIFVGSS